VIAKGLCRKCYGKKWYEGNKERWLEYGPRWRENNRERFNRNKRKYYKTPDGKKAVKKAVKNYESKNKHKVSVWAKAKKVSNKPCEICGKSPAHRHHEDYNKPTEIVYLCPHHHKQIHKELV